MPSMLVREREGELGEPVPVQELDWVQLRFRVVARLRRKIGEDLAQETASEAIVRSMQRLGSHATWARACVDVDQCTRMIGMERIREREALRNVEALPETSDRLKPTEFLRTSAAGARRDEIVEQRRIDITAQHGKSLILSWHRTGAALTDYHTGKTRIDSATWLSYPKD